MDAELSFRHVVRPRRIGMSSRWKTSRLARSRRVHRRARASARGGETERIRAHHRVGGEFVGIRHRSIFGSREPGVPREVAFVDDDLSALVCSTGFNVVQTRESRLRPSLRQCKYLNNVIEQDHRFIKRRTRPMLGFKRFTTAWRTVRGIEIMHALRKGQARWMAKGDVVGQTRLIHKVFGLAV